MRIKICLHREPEAGGYSVYVPAFPGALSQGETKEEAIDNITEALLALIESYEDDGGVAADEYCFIEI